MRYGSVCSGIEAATQAWRPLGWEAAFFSEIERFPSAVLAHHYGSNMPGEAPGGNGVPNHGDMTKFQEWPDHAIDVLVGGTPCQSFSVAGLRRGLADPRGNLALTYLAIAARYRPRWVVWENVPGVLSSGSGRDFGSFLGGLGQLGYGFAYRVLDAQFVRTCDKPGAVPQRRRRVFVVGYLGDWRRAAAVLFDRESLSGNPPPRREAGQGFTHDAAPCLTSSGRGVERGGDTRGQDPVVAHALRGEGFDASEDGTGRGTPLTAAIQERAVSENLDNGPQGSGVRDDGAACTLEARNKVQAVAFAQNTRDEVRLIGGDGQSVGDLAAESGMKQQAYVACFDDPRRFTGLHGGFEHGDVHPTVESTNPKHFVACFDDRRGRCGDLASSEETTNTIHAAKGPSEQQCVATSMAVRRLTPAECEALQGFPRDFTRIPYRGKPADQCPDGPRYKALGNSMAVNVMSWIGERIALVDAIQSSEAAA